MALGEQSLASSLETTSNTFRNGLNYFTVRIFVCINLNTKGLNYKNRNGLGLDARRCFNNNKIEIQTSQFELCQSTWSFTSDIYKKKLLFRHPKCISQTNSFRCCNCMISLLPFFYGYGIKFIAYAKYGNMVILPFGRP